jgi:formylglycine-generating enzyme required for sulfatase activity
VPRNTGAAIVLMSEDEWYKAAYYSAASTNYFDYPAGSDAAMTCAAPTATPNRANCDDPSDAYDPTDADVDNLTTVGSFTGSASAYGTFDQGGNVREWLESVVEGRPRDYPRQRGGSWYDSAGSLAASDTWGSSPQSQDSISGFRLAMIPEPGTGLLVVAGLLGLGGWRRTHA